MWATGALPYVLSSQIKTYAVLAKTRWFAAPEIPTSEELGVPGINISFWHGLWVSGKTMNVPTEHDALRNCPFVGQNPDFLGRSNGGRILAGFHGALAGMAPFWAIGEVAGKVCAKGARIILGHETNPART